MRPWNRRRTDQLDAVILGRKRLLGALAAPPRLAGELLRVLQLAVDHRPHRSEGKGVPDVLRHPQLLGQARVGRELAIDRGDVAQLQVLTQLVGVASDHHLAVLA